MPTRHRPMALTWLRSVVAQCQATDCGAIFLQTDERQQFCPPREGQDKSTCMNRERVRRYRRQRKEIQHGKATRPR